MERAARAALKWKKIASRRAADRAAGKDTSRTPPPSGFEDVVLLLLQDSRKKKTAHDKKQQQRGDRHATTKLRAKGDVENTGPGQRVSASSIHEVLDAGIDADVGRRPSADGGKSAPESGSSDRRNGKKRARGRSQSIFRCVSVSHASIRCVCVGLS